MWLRVPSCLCVVRGALVSTMPVRQRVVISSDAANEADDQFAIAHALLTPSIEVRGLVAAHFGRHPGRPVDSLQESRGEMERLLALMGLAGAVRVESGARVAMRDERTPVDSAGARFLLDEALRSDDRPLHVVCIGPLTDVASALLIEPDLAKAPVRVVWVGGTDAPTHYGPEFNLANDVHAANLIMRSSLDLTRIPYPLYRRFCVSHAELEEKVGRLGKLGRFLVDRVLEVNASSVPAREYRSLGDSPAVGMVFAPLAGSWVMRPPVEYDPATFLPRGPIAGRPVREVDAYDARFLLEDMFAKLAHHACERKGNP